MSGMAQILAQPALDRQTLQAAVDAAVQYLWKTQRPDGSWESLCDIGPIATAQLLVTLHYLGRLDPSDARDASRWLIGQQRDDGSWAGHPFAETGDLGTTATAWAALHVAGVPDDAPAVRGARRFIHENGGLEEVVRGVSRGNPAALNLALAGLLDPRRLPRFPLTHCLIPPLREVMQRRFNGAVLTVFLEMAILARRLRGDWGLDGRAKPPLDEQACRYCLSLLDEFQNADGSWWNGVTAWSGLSLATLHALALPESPDRIERGLPPITYYQVRDEHGLHWLAFGDGVWATGFNLRALMAAGVRGDDPGVVRAVDWLLDGQVYRPQSRLNNRRPDVPRTGGWAWQRTIESLPDVDDTAVVLGSLATALPQTSATGRAEKIRSSARCAVDWVLGMQNRDGGWGRSSVTCPKGRPASSWPTRPQSISPIRRHWQRCSLSRWLSSATLRRRTLRAVSCTAWGRLG